MTPAAGAFSGSAARPACRPSARGPAQVFGRVAGRLARVRLLGWELSEFSSRVVIGVLFTMLTARMVGNFLETGRVTNLLLVASEALVVILTVVRRPALAVDRTWRSRIVTALSILGPPLIRPAVAATVPDVVTATMLAGGLAFVIAAKISLGRSFGLVAANRGVVSSGLYRLVRHPIYLGYLVTHAAFLLANPTIWNALVLGFADVALVVRSLIEERTLRDDPGYVAYRAAVRWRLVPGVF